MPEQWHYKRNLRRMPLEAIEESAQGEIGGPSTSAERERKRRAAQRIRETLHDRGLDTPLGVQVEMFD